MFNIVLLHGSEVKKPNKTKAEAIKFVQMRFSKIIPESFELFSKIAVSYTHLTLPTNREV